MNAFDRSYARGPWRALPVPTHLADRRTGLVFQLAWAGALAVLVAAATWIADARLQGALFQAGGLGLLRDALPLLLTAIGMAVVFARGGFDLSVGSISSLAAIVAVQTGSPWLALLAALACGLANGLLVGLLRVPGWLVTGFTVALVHRVSSSLLMGVRFHRLRDPASMDWALSAAPLVAIGAGVVALAWTQLLPAGAPGRGRLRRLVADAVLPHLFSAGLAAMAGFALAARVKGAGTGPSEWLDLAVVVVVGGTFLGAGRANVLGVVVAALGLGVLRSALIATGAPYGIPLKQALLVLGTALSFGAHALAARRHARAHPEPGPAPAQPEPARPRLFERGLFQGPGRIVPVPVHLTDRRCALRVELVWCAALLAAVAFVLVPAALDKGAGWASASFLGPQLVVPLLLALGASAVIARGGFDFSALALMGLASQLGALRGDPWLAFAVALAVGLVNGGLVVALRVPGWIATFATALLLQLGAASLVGTVRMYQLSEESMRWVPWASVVALAVAAAGAVVWLQLVPGRPPAGRVAPWRARIADGLPYVFSSALAGVAGVYLLARITNLASQLTVGEETLTAVLLAGCWLGAGRANVVGVLLAVVGVVSLEFHVMARQPHPSAVLAVLGGAALLALAASRVVHLRVGRAYARTALQGDEDEPLTTPG